MASPVFSSQAIGLCTDAAFFLLGRSSQFFSGVNFTQFHLVKHHNPSLDGTLHSRIEEPEISESENSAAMRCYPHVKEELEVHHDAGFDSFKPLRFAAS